MASAKYLAGKTSRNGSASFQENKSKAAAPNPYLKIHFSRYLDVFDPVDRVGTVVLTGASCFVNRRHVRGTAEKCSRRYRIFDMISITLGLYIALDEPTFRRISTEL
jgi:hypothetical protein